ncbi:MAG: hypothetical protein J6330_06435 [Clostridia bacterium]|nr:hypothetical protein [Clostridia bacterium]
MKLTIGKSTASFIYLILFCAALAISTASGVSDRYPEIIFFIYLAGMLLFLLFISRGDFKTTNDKLIFWGATAVKIAYALYRFPISDIAYPHLSGDAGGFWRTAVQYYGGDFDRVYTTFPYVLNFEFHIFGKNVLCCCLTNIVLSMLMVLLVIKVLNKFNIYGNGRFFATFISALLVYGIQVSNSILRESIYFAFVTASFYMYIEYIGSKRQSRLYLALLFMIPVLILHIGYFPIAAVYIFDVFTREKVRTNREFANRAIIILVFVVFVVFASRLSSTDYVTKGRGVEGIISRIVGANSDEFMGEAGSRYLAGLKITSIPTFLLYSPIKFIYYMFSPLPTNWRGLTDILAFLLDGCVHLACLLMSVKCLNKLKRENSDGRHDADIRILRVGFWSVVLCGFVFGLGTATAGTAIRHRDVMIGVESLLIGMSAYYLKKSVPVVTVQADALRCD